MTESFFSALALFIVCYEAYRINNDEAVLIKCKKKIIQMDKTIKELQAQVAMLSQKEAERENGAPTNEPESEAQV